VEDAVSFAIPYIHLPTYDLFGVIPLHPFGILVALAVVTGFLLARRRARRTGLDAQLCGDAMMWIVLAGFVTAHLVDALLYYPDQVQRDPLLLLEVWRDISSVGGFLGGALAAILFFRRKRAPLLKYVDAIVFGLTPAWILGRAGCAVVHDHPGVPTSFFLGVRFPDGVVRHDLGLEEMLFAVVLTVVLYALGRWRPFDGLHTALVLLLYAPVRFLLDCLRVADRTYFGLTAAQYGCVAMVLVGGYLMARGLALRSLAGSSAPRHHPSHP
jgi:phosphatidylglycerol:prolipoprotein diacylglycerol transferase